jgi:chromosome segregation ATPase
LVVFFSIPIKGIAQTEDNKIGSKKQNTNSHLSSPTKSPRKNKLSTGSVNTSSEFKALEKKLSLANKQLAKSKKSDTQKGVEIKKLKSDSAKLSGEIKVLEKKLSLAKAELKGLKETDSKKNEELIKLNENINFLLDSIDDQKDELAELSIHSKTSEKYKEIIKCYRAALFGWNNLVSKQSLTEKEYLVVTVELRRSLFACPPT